MSTRVSGEMTTDCVAGRLWLGRYPDIWSRQSLEACTYKANLERGLDLALAALAAFNLLSECPSPRRGHEQALAFGY